MARRLEPTVFLATISPLTVCLVAGTIALVVVLGAPWWLATICGLLVWAARIGLSALIARRVAGLDPRIDPFTLREPWRFFVRDALHTRNRFQEAIDQADDGPLRQRLEEIGSRIGDGVDACWDVARRGQQLTDARRRIDVAALDRTLATTEESDARHRSATAQRASYVRLEERENTTRERLEVLDAQLNESVVRAMELATRTGGDPQLVAAEIETVVDELDSLRVALDDLGVDP